MALDIEVVTVNAATCKVKLSGSLDTQSSPELDRKMESVLADARVRIILLELHDLVFISSLGMGSIARIKNAITARRGSTVTIGARPPIAKVFEIVKLMPKETIFASREEADRYLTAIQKQVIDEQRAQGGAGNA